MANRDEQTVQRLISLCVTYQDHLRKLVLKAADEEFDHDVSNPEADAASLDNMQYDIDTQSASGGLVIPKAIETIRAKSFANWSENDVIVYKEHLVEQLLSKLTDDTGDRLNMVHTFLRLPLPNSNVTNQDVLAIRRNDSMAKVFLEGVLNVLTLGIYSKVSKGTFRFWQTHGEALGKQVQDEIRETQANSRS